MKFSLEEQIFGRCVHFNGVQNTECRAGVVYGSFRGDRLPCLRSSVTSATCEKLRFPTEEDVAARVAAFESGHSRFGRALQVVQADMVARGLRKGRGGQGQVVCPICSGALAYSVASCNGHVHGRCATDGCVWWMQ